MSVGNTYLHDIGRYTNLDRAAEVKLFAHLRKVESTAALCSHYASLTHHRPAKPCSACRCRLQQALDPIVGSLLKWVVRLAKKYNHQGVLFEDLVSAGNVGILRAAEDFDLNKGVSFCTYATCWIKQRMQAEIRDRGHLVRVPAGLQERRVRRQPQQPNEYTAAADAILHRRLVSLSFPIRHRGESKYDSLSDTISDPRFPDPAEEAEQRDTTKHQRRLLWELLRCLPRRYRYLLILRWGLGRNKTELSQAQIGVRWQISRERVRQLEVMAVQHLFRAVRRMREQGDERWQCLIS